jgi:hypothetical protein
MGICRCRLSASGFRLPDWLYSRKQEGSGAFGARVLSFVRCAPNDGFGPESASPSGLVQRGVLYAAFGGSREAAYTHRLKGDTTTL